MKIIAFVLCLQFVLSPLAVAQTANSSCASGDKACYEARARDVLKQAESEGKVEEELKSKGGLINTGMKAATVAVPLLLVTHLLFKAKKAGPKCGSLSLYMLIGGGAVLFVGNIFANAKHKSRLKKIKKEWEGITAKKGDGGETAGSTGAATEGQAEAFEMLAKSEESMASAAKFKAGIHGVAAAAFAASSVMAIMENSRLNGLKANMLAKQQIFTTTPPAPPGPKQTAFTNFKEATVQYREFYQRVHCTNATPPAQDDAWDDIQGFEADQQTLLDDQRELIEEINRKSSAMGGLSASVEKSLLKKNIHVIQQAPDLASFLTLHDGLENSLQRRASPTLDEYQAHKDLTRGIDSASLNEVLGFVKKQAVRFLSQASPLQEARADVAVVDTPGATDVVEGPEIVVSGEKMPKLGFINKYLFAPVPRAAIAGVFAIWSGIMAMHSSKQAKVSQARAKFLREQKKSFDVSSGQIAVGSQKAESQGADAQASVGSGTQSLAGISADKTCMSTAGVEPSCKCRSSNSCLQVTPNNLSPQNFGLSQDTLSFGASGAAPMNAIANWQSSAATIDAASAVNNASRMLDARNKTAAKTKGVAEEQAKLVKDADTEFSKATKGFSSGNALASTRPSTFNMSPSSAVAELEKELKKATEGIPRKESSDGVISTSPVAAETAVTQEELTAAQVANVMKEDLDYSETGTDISASKESIFNVISNRYQRSNLKLTIPQEESAKP